MLAPCIVTRLIFGTVWEALVALAVYRPLVYHTDRWSITQPYGGVRGRHARICQEEGSPVPRVVKHPELRRNEFLDCAQALFLERGFDNASLNEVIIAAGVSKGAFYHYFASKEALLEALAARFAEAALARIRSVLDDPDLDALERLNAFLAKGRQDKIENVKTVWALFEPLFRPENLVLFHRISVATRALVSPVLRKIISQGVADGIFDTFDPEGAADMILQLGTATQSIVSAALGAGSPEQMDEAIRALERRIKLYEIALARILGLPDGSIRLSEPGYIRTVMTAGRKQMGATTSA
jgi:AcrR family transcriptional regulator